MEVIARGANRRYIQVQKYLIHHIKDAGSVVDERRGPFKKRIEGNYSTN